MDKHSDANIRLYPGGKGIRSNMRGDIWLGVSPVPPVRNADESVQRARIILVTWGIGDNALRVGEDPMLLPVRFLDGKHRNINISNLAWIRDKNYPSALVPIKLAGIVGDKGIQRIAKPNLPSPDSYRQPVYVYNHHAKRTHMFNNSKDAAKKLKVPEKAITSRIGRNAKDYFRGQWEFRKRRGDLDAHRELVETEENW